MLCPKDLVQMHQHDKTGGGESTDTEYTTWEVKECPICGRKVLEFYSAMVLTDDELAKIATRKLVYKIATEK